MTWRQVIPTTFTLMAMLAGVSSILIAREGQFELAAQLIMLAMLLDGLDGNLARMLKGATEFGGELDTYVDLTAFGLAPAILFYSIALQGHQMWRVLVTAAIVLSGVIRLARFKVVDPERGQKGYTGLPITANAAWVAMLVYLSERGLFGESAIAEGPFAAIFLGGVLLFIALQISNYRYPKPTKYVVTFLPCVVLVLMFAFGGPRLAIPAAFITIALGLGYILLGPAVGRRLSAARRGSVD